MTADIFWIMRSLCRTEGRSMKTTMNEYQIFITKLFAACEIGEDNVVLLDTNRVSEVLEEEFVKVGLLKSEE